MKEYKWDKKDLKNTKKDLFNIIDKDNLDIDEENICKSDLIVLQEILDETKLKNIIYSYIPEFLIKRNFSNLSNDTYRYSTLFQRDMIVTSKDVFKELAYDRDSKKALNIKMPINDQMLLAKEVYNSFDPCSYNFDKITDSNNHFLNMSKYIKNSLSFNLGNNGYILIGNTSDKVITYQKLVHELGHFYECNISNRYNDEEDCKYINYQEVISILFEHIGCQLLEDKGIISNQQKLDIMDDIRRINTDIYYYIKLLSITCNPNPSFKEQVLARSPSNPLMDAMYYYSYLIAVNLYYIYMQDKKYAVDYFNHIANDINPDNEISILNEIKFNEEHQILKKHLIKLDKRNN